MQQRRTFWERFKNFVGDVGTSITNWMTDHPIQATAVTCFSVAVGLGMGFLSGGSLFGILGGLFSSLGIWGGGTYFGVITNNSEIEANRLAAAQAQLLSAVTQLTSNQTQLTQTNLQQAEGLVQNQQTMERLQTEINRQRAMISNLERPAYPVAYPAEQVAPGIPFFPRTETAYPVAYPMGQPAPDVPFFPRTEATYPVANPVGQMAPGISFFERSEVRRRCGTAMPDVPPATNNFNM
jgi:hypothetical protein